MYTIYKHIFILQFMYIYELEYKYPFCEIWFRKDIYTPVHTKLW